MTNKVDKNLFQERHTALQKVGKPLKFSLIALGLITLFAASLIYSQGVGTVGMPFIHASLSEGAVLGGLGTTAGSSFSLAAITHLSGKKNKGDAKKPLKKLDSQIKPITVQEEKSLLLKRISRANVLVSGPVRKDLESDHEKYSIRENLQDPEVSFAYIHSTIQSDLVKKSAAYKQAKEESAALARLERQKESHPEVLGEDGYNEFHRVILGGRLNTFARLMLPKLSSLIETVSKNEKQNALHLLGKSNPHIDENRLKLLKILIKNGGEKLINVQDINGDTPLHIALQELKAKETTVGLSKFLREMPPLEEQFRERSVAVAKEILRARKKEELFQYQVYRTLFNIKGIDLTIQNNAGERLSDLLPDKETLKRLRAELKDFKQNNKFKFKDTNIRNYF